MATFKRRRSIRREPPAFEESINGEWGKESDVVEIPLDNRALFYLGLVIFSIGALVAGRVIFLGLFRDEFYRARAEVNSSEAERVEPPRGLIYDRNGEALALNQPAFFALLNTREFIRASSRVQETTLKDIERTIGLFPDEVWKRIRERDQNRLGEKIVLSTELTQSQLVQLKSLDLVTISVRSGFRREYKDGQVFSPVVGYTGLISPDDLKRFPTLSGRDFIGKTGIEAFYDGELRGKPGVRVALRDAKGESIEEKGERPAESGEALHLTVDAGLQRYFYSRLGEGLRELGRKVGIGLALNPKSGEILSLVTVPSYDNNLFASSGNNKEKQELLTSPLKPLFNRVVSGLYSPGSTIKPLVAVAALAEGVISPDRQIFSPGYLDVPNPYDPSNPTRFLDWRRQGWVNLRRAIAQSSNVYFYTVGGGHEDVRGLGIARLRAWWQKFKLGQALGVDLPGEAAGLLPSIELREERGGPPWRLGDTYNVSIGQGDLLITPLQLLTYIGAIANGGTIYQPFVAQTSTAPRTLADLTPFLPNILEVQAGMEDAVRLPLGTAYLLHDLPFSSAGKTGTAQIQNNEQANAFFVGYAPAEDPEIAILVLVEQSKEGSLNTVPIAKDVLNWYYKNRMVGGE